MIQTKEDFTTIPLLFAPLARVILSFLTGMQRPADHILNVQLCLQSPAETVVLDRGIQTSGIILCYMNGVALFCGQKGILFHDIDGKLYF